MYQQCHTQTVTDGIHMVTVNSDLWLIEIAMCKAEQSKIGQQIVSKLDGWSTNGISSINNPDSVVCHAYTNSAAIVIITSENCPIVSLSSNNTSFAVIISNSTSCLNCTTSTTISVTSRSCPIVALSGTNTSLAVIRSTFSITCLHCATTTVIIATPRTH